MTAQLAVRARMHLRAPRQVACMREQKLASCVFWRRTQQLRQREQCSDLWLQFDSHSWQQLDNLQVVDKWQGVIEQVTL